ncbi:MAG: NUDIX domain-containing protein [Bacteroidales bacterium]|nr:NUDIX domain-containing protein [Bacteroidales bacterium]
MLHPFHQFAFCPKCGSNLFIVNNEKSKKCESCGFVFYFNISAAVAVFILNHKNELLVCRRAHEPAKGTLDLPGGFVDMEESAEEAVLREVEEETGLKLSNIEYQFSLPNKYIYSDFEVQTLDLFYRTSIDGTNGISAHDDVAEVLFIPIDQLNPLDFGLHSIRIAISRFQQEKNK